MRMLAPGREARSTGKASELKPAQGKGIYGFHRLMYGVCGSEVRNSKQNTRYCGLVLTCPRDSGTFSSAALKRT